MFPRKPLPPFRRTGRTSKRTGRLDTVKQVAGNLGLDDCFLHGKHVWVIKDISYTSQGRVFVCHRYNWFDVVTKITVPPTEVVRQYIP